MVTLNEVKEFLENCKCNESITVVLKDECLELYRFDGEMVDDDVLIATIDKEFTVRIPDGSTHPLNLSDLCDINEDIEDINDATVKEITEAILGNIKVGIVVDNGVTNANIDYIDNIMKNNDMELFDVTDTYGRICRIYHEPKKDYLSVMIMKCSDMEALYIEGEKKYESHKIEANLALFDLINSAIYEHCGGNIDSVDFGCLYVTDEYAESVGFPERLEDIPDEIIDEANQ